MLALDIGGTKIAAAMSWPDGRLGTVHRVSTPAAEGPAAVLAAAVGAGRQALAGATPWLVGVGSAGVIDPVTGVVRHATDALPGWAGTPLAAHLGAEFGARAYALNDVHAHALGEARHGAGRGHRDVLVVAVGTGIGGAIVHDGRVLTGAHALAGHLGHLPCAEAAGLTCPCGRRGHLEALASGPGIAAAYTRQMTARPGTETAHRGPAVVRTGAEVAALATGTGPDSVAARAALTLAGAALGRSLGGLLNVLDPDVVVLTGGVAAAPECWWAAVRAGVAEQAVDLVAGTPLRPAQAGPGAALLGAAAHARDRMTDIDEHPGDNGQS